MPQTSTTPKTSYSPLKKEGPPHKHFSLLRIEPSKVLELQALLHNPELWLKLESLLLMVRQDHLESLASKDITDEELHASRGVAAFIHEFLYEIRPNLQHQAEALQREKSGLPPINTPPEGNAYMELSGDINESPRDLTTTEH